MVLAYKTHRCWPSEIEVLPGLDANGNAVAIQRLVLQNEGWERDYDAAEPQEPTFNEPACSSCCAATLSHGAASLTLRPASESAMPKFFRFALALAPVLLPAGLAAHAQTPRDHVDGIAVAIESNYYDAARGRRIADELRAVAAKGEFDALTDPRDLASALTQRLQPLDRHFAVRWTATDVPVGPLPFTALPGSQPPPPDRAAPGLPPRRAPGLPASTPGHGAPSPDFAAAQRRGNYGVRRVEVLPGNIGYIDLREFADFEFGRSDQPARQAIEAALQLVSGTDALIIDLRDNGGGSPAMVGYLSSAFTPRDAGIYNVFHSRSSTRSEAPLDWYPSPRLQVPLYVLISGRTGSAAEAFAYTMKNARRSTVIGEASAGAANPGGEVDAGHGFRIFVSGGSPISPITGTNWEGSGVIPDIDAAPATALDTARTLALQTVLRLGLPDTQTIEARWALEALRAESAPRTVRLPDYIGLYGPVIISENDGRLQLQRDRRPAWTLIPLGDDLFTIAGEPTRRVTFEREASGKATVLEIRFANGQSMRYRR